MKKETWLVLGVVAILVSAMGVCGETPALVILPIPVLLIVYWMKR